MPHKDPEVRKAYQREYNKKYKRPRTEERRRADRDFYYRHHQKRKAMSRVSNKRRSHERVLWVVAAKFHLGGRCANTNCLLKDPTDLRVLQFDHIDPKKKLFNIGHNGKMKDWNTFWDEVDKCRLLCAACHHIHTHIAPL